MAEPKNLLIEDDVGSGDRSAGQKETDRMIEQLPEKQPGKSAASRPGEAAPSENTDSQSGNPP